MGKSTIKNRQRAASGYYPSPWSCEDGGPERLQTPTQSTGLNLQPGESIKTVSRRLAVGNMVVLRDPGEVYLMSHDMLRANVGLPCSAYVEKIDQHTLETRKKSPRLPGGPMWPGGFSVHRNGDLYVTFGRYMHRLNPNCEIISRYKLPQNLPYNSHVILDSGYLATKPIADTESTQLLIMDPETLKPASIIDMPEPSISRLSASGNTLYVTGVRTIYRYHIDAKTGAAELDPNWSLDYIDDSKQSYGWDPVIDQDNIWFMDNGKHTAMTSMLKAGVSATANNVIRVSVKDSSDYSITPISNLPHGSITNPPFYCPQRRILIAFDSANSFVQAWRHNPTDNELTPLWQRSSFGMSGHGIYYADTGELITEDYKSLKRWEGISKGEQNVILDIETGQEKHRFAMHNYVQSYCFPAAGFGRDYYWLGMDQLTYAWVEGATQK